MSQDSTFRNPLRGPVVGVLLGLALVGAWWASGAPTGPGRPGSPPPVAPAPDARPVRICSVTLATDEMLADLVPVWRVAGVTFLVDDATQSNVAGHYPASIPRVRGEIERIVSVRPDLVCVAPYNLAEFLDLLGQCRLPVFRNEGIHSFEEVLDSTEALGRRVGEPERAGAVVGGARRRLTELAARLAQAPRPRVLYWGGGCTTGRKTTIGEIITRAGGINVGEELGLEGEVAIPVERVLAADPDVVLVAAAAGATPGAGLAQIPAFEGLRAVKSGRIVSLEPRLLTTLSRHLVDAAETLARRLHPECFK